MEGPNIEVVADILVETDLDLEWAGAIAPKATIYYVFGQDAFTAALVAIDSNVAPILSISYGGCELDDADPGTNCLFPTGQHRRSIPFCLSSGDSGAASCDLFQFSSFATHGPSVGSVFPEVTSVGEERSSWMLAVITGRPPAGKVGSSALSSRAA